MMKRKKNFLHAMRLMKTLCMNSMKMAGVLLLLKLTAKIIEYQELCGLMAQNVMKSAVKTL
ncbi:hypothetical protein DMT40_30490 [Klebsiella variicola]|nr:hypothetical protein DMT40_30490 [Klebsiella variicola]